jgi:hypothetical protein
MMSAKRTIRAVMIQSPASERSSFTAASRTAATNEALGDALGPQAADVWGSLEPPTSLVARRDHDLKLRCAIFYKVGPRAHAGPQELHGPRKILRAFPCEPRL